MEDATGKLRLFKCKNEGGGAKNFQRGVAGHQRPISIKSQLYQQQLDGCDCDLRNLLPVNLRPSMMRPFNKKPFFSKKSECSRGPAGGSSEPTTCLSGLKVFSWFFTITSCLKSDIEGTIEFILVTLLCGNIFSGTPTSVRRKLTMHRLISSCSEYLLTAHVHLCAGLRSLLLRGEGQEVSHAGRCLDQ